METLCLQTVQDIITFYIDYISSVAYPSPPIHIIDVDDLSCRALDVHMLVVTYKEFRLLELGHI